VVTASGRPGQDLSAVLKDSPQPLGGAEAGEFADLIAVIKQAQVNAFRAVNRELIAMNTKIGKQISQRSHRKENHHGRKHRDCRATRLAAAPDDALLVTRGNGPGALGAQAPT